MTTKAATVRLLSVDPRARLVTLLAFAAFLTDWVTKEWAVNLLGEHPVGLGRVTLAPVENDGLAFSIGQGLIPLDLILLARLLLFGLCALVAVRSVRMHTAAQAGFGLISAGAVGNLVDLRFRGGAVIDFIGFDPVSLVTGREGFHLFFNVADVCVFVGLALAFPVIRRAGIRVQNRFRSWEAGLLGGLRANQEA